MDIFAAAGLKKPDISILSDKFLAEVREIPHRNLAIELLRRLLHDEIKARARRNLVQSRSFAEMLEAAIRKYQNRSIETAQVISELIELAKEMREAQRRGEHLGLNDEEVAFYDALEVNDSAVKVLCDETLRVIARELLDAVRRSVTIDWTVRENARAAIRVIVKRILRKYGYPPNKQEKATQTVFEQAELLCKDWSAEARLMNWCDALLQSHRSDSNRRPAVYKTAALPTELRWRRDWPMTHRMEKSSRDKYPLLTGIGL